MPTYQYRCTECDTPLEVVQSFSDSALTVCPTCGGRLRKVFSAVGVVFKGSGFYRNDSRDNGKAPASSSSADATSGAGASESSGSKVEAKSADGSSSTSGDSAAAAKKSTDTAAKSDTAAPAARSGESRSGSSSPAKPAAPSSGSTAA